MEEKNYKAIIEAILFTMGESVELEKIADAIELDKKTTKKLINEMMQEMGLPFAYHHFAEGESPEPPFLLFLSPGENTFSADNSMYFSFKMLDIELYTDVKNPELEKQVEQVLKRHKIYYTKSEVWIESEKLYEVLYETEV